MHWELGTDCFVGPVGHEEGHNGGELVSNFWWFNKLTVRTKPSTQSWRKMRLSGTVSNHGRLSQKGKRTNDDQ